MLRDANTSAGENASKSDPLWFQLKDVKQVRKREEPLEPVKARKDELFKLAEKPITESTSKRDRSNLVPTTLLFSSSNSHISVCPHL